MKKTRKRKRDVGQECLDGVRTIKNDKAVQHAPKIGTSWNLGGMSYCVVRYNGDEIVFKKEV